MKKNILLLQAFCLFAVACVTQAAETTPHMTFIITNNTKKTYVTYSLIDPMGKMYYGYLSHSSALSMKEPDYTLNKHSIDDAPLGTYLLHYRVFDMWRNTLYADDAVVTLQKNSTVIWAISDEDKKLTTTILDL